MHIQNNLKPELGVKNGALNALSRKPNCISTQTDVKAKKVPAIAYQKSLSEQMQRVISVIECMPGVTIKQCSNNYLHAVFTSKIMRFKDDVEVYLDDTAKMLHFRSASRVGYSDLGVNRKRYECFVKALSEK